MREIELMFNKTNRFYLKYGGNQPKMQLCEDSRVEALGNHSYNKKVEDKEEKERGVGKKESQSVKVLSAIDSVNWI